MLFKLSFNDGSDTPSKKVETFYEKTTMVTLKGMIRFSDDKYGLAEFLEGWVTYHKGIKLSKGLYGWYFTAQGKAKRNPTDKDDKVLAERVAESRAKLKLYKFLAKFATGLKDFYLDLIYGQYMDILTQVCRGWEEEHRHESCLTNEISKWQMLANAEQNHIEELLHGINTESD